MGGARSLPALPATDWQAGGFSGDGLLKMTIPAVYCFVLEIQAGPA